MSKLFDAIELCLWAVLMLGWGYVQLFRPQSENPVMKESP